MLRTIFFYYPKKVIFEEPLYTQTWTWIWIYFIIIVLHIMANLIPKQGRSGLWTLEYKNKVDTYTQARRKVLEVGGAIALEPAKRLGG